MQNIFLFILVVHLNQIYKSKFNNLISKLSIPSLFIVCIYAFVYLNFINIYLNYQKLEFKHGWRSIKNYKYNLKRYEEVNGLNFYFIEGYCWFEKTLCTSGGQYFDYKTKVKKFYKNYIIYLEK